MAGVIRAKAREPGDVSCSRNIAGNDQESSTDFDNCIACGLHINADEEFLELVHQRLEIVFLLATFGPRQVVDYKVHSAAWLEQ